MKLQAHLCRICLHSTVVQFAADVN